MASFIPNPPTIKSFFEQHGQKLEYDKGQTFVRADDPQPWVYFLVEGIVEATYSFDNGLNRILGYFIENAIFSQNRLLQSDDEGDLKYTVVKKVTVLRVHRDVFLQQIDTNHTFTKEYLQNSLIFRIFTTDLVIYLGEGNIHNRCIRWLAMMAKYYGEDTDQGRRIYIPFTQETIASFLHATRESVSKTLRKFIRSGYITVHKKTITITNLKGLKSLLENQ